MDGLIPFMSEIVHPKVVLCSLNTRNNFSSSLGVSDPQQSLERRNYHPKMHSEDAQVIALTLEL